MKTTMTTTTRTKKKHGAKLAPAKGKSRWAAPSPYEAELKALRAKEAR